MFAGCWSQQAPGEDRGFQKVSRFPGGRWYHVIYPLLYMFTTYPTTYMNHLGYTHVVISV